MQMLSVYHDGIPSFLLPYLQSDAIQRLKGIDMNCGMNFTSFPLFRSLEPYSRYEHSLGTALIVWHFTRDRVSSLAALFHDISTPAFSHVVDFMKGDYVRQEANENETESLISRDPVIMKQLKEDGISLQAVSDYHQYPIADNRSPHLSADRLEYTCGDIQDYHLGNLDEIREIFQDLVILKNEEGEEEIGFMHAGPAEKFAQYALQCGHIYSCKEDRYAMDRLSDLLKECMQDGTLSQADLYMSESDVIRKICSSSHQKDWENFSALSHVQSAPDFFPGSRQIAVKKRFIDPLVSEQGRVSELFPDLKKQMLAFQKDDMKEWLKGDTY